MLPRKPIWLPQLPRIFLMGKRRTFYKNIHFCNVKFYLTDKPIQRENALSRVDSLTETQALTILRFRFSF